MPTYVYRNSKGEEREIVAPMSAMPSEFLSFPKDTDGTEYRLGMPGATEDDWKSDPYIFRRVPVGGQTINAGPVRNKYPIVSRTLPKNLPGCKTDRYGASVITSRRHEQQIIAKHGYRRME